MGGKRKREGELGAREDEESVVGKTTRQAKTKLSFLSLSLSPFSLSPPFAFVFLLVPSKGKIQKSTIDKEKGERRQGHLYTEEPRSLPS